jgi:hypothetical protein
MRFIISGLIKNGNRPEPDQPRWKKKQNICETTKGTPTYLNAEHSLSQGYLSVQTDIVGQLKERKGVHLGENNPHSFRLRLVLIFGKLTEEY